jgi:hypothetical protein
MLLFLRAFKKYVPEYRYSGYIFTRVIRISFDRYLYNTLCLFQVVKGQYLNVGVSTISSPALCSTLLLGHTPRRPALIAQCVKFKAGFSQPKKPNANLQIVFCLKTLTLLFKKLLLCVLFKNSYSVFCLKTLTLCSV